MRNYFKIYLSLMLISVINLQSQDSRDWMLKSIEFKANCATIYKSATQILDSALYDRLWSAEVSQAGQEDIWDKKPAIIFDIDETVLDNSGFYKVLEENDTTYDERLWKKWEIDAKAIAIVGAVDFIKYATSKGIEIFYITNRECIPNDSNKCPEQDYTLSNLEKLGIKTDDYHLLLMNEYKNWKSDKQIRRQMLTEQYRILMLFGDDLNDFVNNAINLSYDEKYKEFIKYYNFFGEKWFILPNPVYGSWTKTK